MTPKLPSEFPRTCELLRSLGIDPDNVPVHGSDETGYLWFGEHPDGVILARVADEPVMSRVPWPSPEAWEKFQAAQVADGMPPMPHAAADAVDAAADWLEAIRYETWNGGERRPSNYARAAADLRRYAAGLRGAL